MLTATDGLKEVIWIGVPTAILGGFGALALAPNGIDPAVPGGRPLEATDLFAVYYAPAFNFLRDQILQDHYTARQWPWDWRKSILDAGDTLAGDIYVRVLPSDPCTLLCHSAGGLVARRAWSTLGGLQAQDRVRRIITLGTPHWGSYFVALAWSGVAAMIDALYALNVTMAYTLGGVQQYPAYRAWTKRQIADLLLTFPCLYELLPSLLAPSAGSDPNRIDLFTAANWGGGVLPQQAWLDHAVNVFQPWAASGSSQPPDNVMTCVAGLGYSTPTALGLPGFLGEARAIDQADVGDGIVTRDSALL